MFLHEPIAGRHRTRVADGTDRQGHRAAQRRSRRVSGGGGTANIMRFRGHPGFGVRRNVAAAPRSRLEPLRDAPLTTAATPHLLTQGCQESPSSGQETKAKEGGQEGAQTRGSEHTVPTGVRAALPVHISQQGQASVARATQHSEADRWSTTYLASRALDAPPRSDDAFFRPPRVPSRLPASVVWDGAGTGAAVEGQGEPGGRAGAVFSGGWGTMPGRQSAPAGSPGDRLPIAAFRDREIGAYT